MSAPKDGGPAFPIPVSMNSVGEPVHSYEYGMSLRDYFAGQAPEPPEVNAEEAAKIVGVTTAEYLADIARSYAAFRAHWAYRYADAMIAARSSESGRREGT